MASSTYREKLAIKYPTHGHALWEPDPGGLYDVVEVGDVGFISREGYFCRLFNALHPRDHTDRHALNYPQRLEPKKSLHIRRSRDNQKDFCSKNVAKLSSEPDIHALG